jgi:hypothetical protein
LLCFALLCFALLLAARHRFLPRACRMPRQCDAECA